MSLVSPGTGQTRESHVIAKIGKLQQSGVLLKMRERGGLSGGERDRVEYFAEAGHVPSGGMFLVRVCRRSMQGAREAVP